MIDWNDTTAWWKSFPGRMIAEMIPTAHTTHPGGLWTMHVHSLPPLVRPRAIPSDCYTPIARNPLARTAKPTIGGSTPNSYEQRD